MKSLYHTLVFNSLIVFISLNPVFAATDNDTIHTIEYIESISITEPCKTKEKEVQIVEQAARLRESRMTLFFAGCLILLLDVLLWRTIRHFRIVKAKNIAMVEIICEQLAYKDELFRCEEEVRSLREALQQKAKGLNCLQEAAQERETLPSEMQPQSEAQSKGTQPAETSAETPAAGSHLVDEYTDTVMQGLFAKANYEIISRKLYLQPEFSREDLIEAVHIPKNKFAGLFKKYTGLSFSKYINKLRLEHAARMLEEHPEYSIEAIAANCGISSSTTFYRLFSERFGMTPKDFRNGVRYAESK